MEKVEMMNEVRELLKKHDKKVVKVTLAVCKLKLGKRLADYALNPLNRSKSLQECICDILNEYEDDIVECVLRETK